MDIQSGQAPLLKRNQHKLDFYSLSGTEYWAPLQLSPILPTYPSNTRESGLHPYKSDANQPYPAPIDKPRSLPATTLPPYISDENHLSYTTNALRRTSFSTLNVRGSHGHQPTKMEYPLPSSTPTASLHFDDKASSYHYLNQTSSYAALQRPQLNIYTRYSSLPNLIKSLLITHS